MKHKFFASKLNTVLLLVLIISMVFAISFMLSNKEVGQPLIENKQPESQEVKGTYTYTNHGFSIELPKGYIPKEDISVRGNHTDIYTPDGVIVYITDADVYEKTNLSSWADIGNKKIGNNNFKVYTRMDSVLYWFRQGKIGYALGGNKDTFNTDKFDTFKFVGWPKCENEFCVDTLPPTNIISTKPTSYEAVGITKGELEKLITKAWGDCDQVSNCNNRTVEIAKADIKIGESLWQNNIVTVTFNGLYDDSVGASRYIAKIYKNASGDEVWRLSEPVSMWKCHQGRGHQDFSTVICS